MIYALGIFNVANEQLQISMKDPADGYFIAGIDGLDPVDAQIVTTSVVGVAGEQEQSVRRGKRNILLRIGMDAGLIDKTVSQLRNDLYPFLSPSKKVRLRFYDNENPTLDIKGTIESFDAPLYVKEPGAVVSVLCMDPDFYVEDSTIFSANTTPTVTETNLLYAATVDTGFQFQLNVNRTVAGFTIYNRYLDNSVKTMAITYPFLNGDIVRVCTIPGQKSVTVTRAGITTSILYALSPQSGWINLEPGSNMIRVQADGAGIPYTITYNVKYGAL